MVKPKILVFASGSKCGGGSGFENLVLRSREGVLDAAIVGVVSNHLEGGVYERAQKFGIPFTYFPAPYSQEAYERIVNESGAEWFALSGWLKQVHGLSPKHTFNIHPALLSQLGGKFGGEMMYGSRVHQAVSEAFHKKEITHSGVSMHFVTEKYDDGPVFFEYPVSLTEGMTAEDIQKIVNHAEHEWQPKITNLVVHEEITWDGTRRESLVVPPDYQFLPQH